MEESGDARILPPAYAEGLLDAEQQAVEGAPAEEGPIGAVPDAADDERDEQVDVAAGGDDAVAAEGYVDVVLEPRGEGDVPAVPELADAAGEVRAAEVVHQAEAQHAGHADGDE